MSIIPVAIIAGVWFHLAKQGLTTQTIWLGCNVLDSLRALRLIKPNGRAVGQRTRRRSLQQALVCWMTFVAIQCAGSLPDRLLAWLPVYSLLRTIVVSTFLLVRIHASETIYTSTIQPLLQKYETPIDLTIELVSSLVMLIYHFTLEYPLDRLRSVAAPYISPVATFLPFLPNHVGSARIESPTCSLDSPKVDACTTSKIDSDANVPGAYDRLSVEEILQTAKRICEKQPQARPSSPGDKASRPLPRSVARLRPTHSLAGPKHRAPTARPAVPVCNDPFTETKLGIAARAEDVITMSQPPIVRCQELPSKPTTKRMPPARRNIEGLLAHNLSDRVFRDPSIDMPPAKMARTNNGSRATKPTVRRSTAPSPPSIPDTRPAPPTSRNVNISKPSLSKAKSASELKPKPLAATEAGKRPFKSSPARRSTKISNNGDEDAKTQKVTTAAERSKEIRQRNRREQGVQPGEKRRPPPLNLGEVPGSKRTRFTVAKD